MQLPSVQISALARELGLGDFVGGHRQSTNLVTYLVGGITAGWIGLSGVLIILSINTMGTYGIVLGAVLLAVAAGLVVLIVATARNRVFYLYRNGIVTTTVRGRVRLAAQWANLQLYWQRMQRSLPPNAVHDDIYQVARDGKVLFRHGEGEDAGPGRQLRELFAAARVPAAVERVRAGEPLSFGPIQATEQGLVYAQTTVPWSRITGVSYRYGSAYIEVAGAEPIRVASRKVPDLVVLHHLIEKAGEDRV